MHKPEKVQLLNMCLIYKDNKILVQERTKKDWPGITFPGGHVNKGEDIISSVIREVKEETGLTISNPILCGIEEYKNNDKCDRYIAFLFKTNKFKGKLKSSKEGKVYWMDIKEFKKAELSLDLDIMYKIMTSANLSDLIYYKEKDEWKKKVL